MLRDFKLRIKWPIVAGISAIVVPITLLVFAVPTPAHACGGFFDVECNLNNGGLDPNNVLKQAQKAADDARIAAEKAANDARIQAERTQQDIQRQIDQTRRDLGPFGPWLVPNLIPPYDVAFRCIQDLEHCPKELIARAAYEVARPIVDQYLNYLHSQTSNNFYRLPDDFVELAQPYYDVDLSGVSYSTGVDTVHGQAITIGNQIFFPENIDLDDEDDAELMYHELEHVVQYKNKGGVEPFLAEYIAKAFGKIIEKRSINIHDEIEIEASAISKAKAVSKSTLGREFLFRNDCGVELRLAIGYRDNDGDWQYEGFWELDSGEAVTPSSGGEVIHSRNRVYYFYAESLDKRKKWSGSKYKNINGDGPRLGFKEAKDDDSSTTLGTNLTCKS